MNFFDSIKHFAVGFLLTHGIISLQSLSLSVLLVVLRIFRIDFVSVFILVSKQIPRGSSLVIDIVLGATAVCLIHAKSRQRWIRYGATVAFILNILIAFGFAL